MPTPAFKELTSSAAPCFTLWDTITLAKEQNNRNHKGDLVYESWGPLLPGPGQTKLELSLRSWEPNSVKASPREGTPSAGKRPMAGEVGWCLNSSI